MALRHSNAALLQGISQETTQAKFLSLVSNVDTSLPFTLRLQDGNSEVLICTTIGGAIARYMWRGIDILRRAPDTAIADRNVRLMGSYVLMPYSNRIGNAVLTMAGRRYALRQNFPPEPHAIHGFGWQRAWCLDQHAENAAHLSLNHEVDDSWPFACDSQQSIRLHNDELLLGLTVTNRDARTMPAGLGFHTFFPLTEETQLQTVWEGIWQTDENRLPKLWEPTSSTTDFSQSRSVLGWRIDNCFTSWERSAVLQYAHHQVAIAASEECQNIVAYAPGDERKFIALEPVTNINNGFALAEGGNLNTGVRYLAQGESLTISMSIKPSERLGGKGTNA
jgi:aldose 1-epimerase